MNRADPNEAEDESAGASGRTRTAAATFVLVHGAFHGGWCWTRVVARLRQAGAVSFAPTLTGLGERAHLLAPGLDWRVFRDDILGVIEAEELEDVVLVGHSFGGIVISAVADRAPERVRRLIYLDLILPENGQSGFDILPREIAEARRRAAAAAGGLAIPVPDAAAFGLPPGPDRDWVQRRLTPQPLASYTEPVAFAGPIGNGRPRLYIRCTDPIYEPVRPTQARLAAEGWEMIDLAVCHDAMITAPAALSDLLLQIS